MICTIISALVIGSAMPPTYCPIGGEAASDKVATVDYAGVRYSFCCDGCPEKFAKDPAAAIRTTKAKGKTIGTFLFDPVSRTKINVAQAKGGYSDYQGVRYLFATAPNKAAFLKSPAAYAKHPAKEALMCPVAKERINGYILAYGYKDVDGVRYFVCCDGCWPKFNAAPKKYVPFAAKAVGEPKAMLLKAGEMPPSECKDE